MCVCVDVNVGGHGDVFTRFDEKISNNFSTYRATIIKTPTKREPTILSDIIYWVTRKLCNFRTNKMRLDIRLAITYGPQKKADQN